MTFDLDRLSPRVRRLVYRTATLLGVALLVAAGLDAGRSLKLLGAGPPLTGVVVAMGPSAPHPFVRFTRPDGQVTTFRADGLKGSRPGQTVSVLFDPSHPGDLPVAATPVVLWLKPALLLILGGLLFGFGFRPRERKAV
ncbi:MAG TPA: DUF3592 domain-containing protein [Caulobacteraceae bacterium]|jgi:hypothetical protein|nr:DUF3592 domain-containing protein [Caulobacteraceae bacterium]